MHAVLAHRSVLCVEGLPAVLRGKALDQLRVRMKFFLAAVELLLAAQYNVRATLDSVDRPANMNGLGDEGLKIAYRFFIFAETDHKKMAVDVGGLGAAYVQKMRAIRRIYHAIDMRRDTDAFVDMRQSLVWNDAGLFAGARRIGDERQQQQSQHASPGHERGKPQPKGIGFSMPGNGWLRHMEVQPCSFAFSAFLQLLYSESRHPERSEGSLHWLSSVIQRSFAPLRMTNRLVSALYTNWRR